jgi:predicted peptidase
MHSVLVVLAAFVATPPVNSEFVDLFQPHEYRFTGGQYDERPFKYRLYVPSWTRSNEKKPLIVWLHGMGDGGIDNAWQLRWLERLIFRRFPWNRYPFFLLAVQCPPDNPAWTRAGSAAHADDMINVAREILEKTLRDFPVDRERVYLSGVSSGGSGCWRFAGRYPEYFAAVAPMASGGGDPSQVDRLTRIPIWAFHSKDDAETKIRSVRETVSALKAAGGNVHLTEVDSAEHDCWSAAFERHLLDWMLSQRRGQKTSWQPGTVPVTVRLRDLTEGWRWWQVLAQVGVPLLIGVAVWHSVRAHRRRAFVDGGVGQS